jgi:hypothetical protein
VAVWNRALRPAEVKETLFNMPQLTSARQLQAPRGVPVDYTAGRVLYVRFNNPCDEGPTMPPPPPPLPPPPTPPTSPQGDTVRRRLSQVPTPNSTPSASRSPGSSRELRVDCTSRRRLGLNPKRTTHRLARFLLGWVWLSQLSDHAIADGSRRNFSADHAGYTAGSLEADGSPIISDTFTTTTTTAESPTFFRNFGGPTAYAFTGVPWAAPFVTAVTLDAGADLDALDYEKTASGEFAWREAGESLLAVPLDGVRMVAHGVGFAPSAFAKCILAQPDPAGEFASDEDAVDGPYDNFFVGAAPARTRTTASAANRFVSAGQVAKTPASTAFGIGLGVPALHRLWDFHSPANLAGTSRSTGFDKDFSTTDGAMNAFQESLPFGSRTRDYVYGSWERMSCVMPAAAFPSDAYSFGISNDAGISASPLVPLTYMDASVRLEGQGGLDLAAVLPPYCLPPYCLASSFTVAMWVRPTTVPASADANGWQNVIDLGPLLRVVYSGLRGGSFHAVLDGAIEAGTVAPATGKATVWHHLVIAVSGRNISLTIDLQRAEFSRTLNAPGFASSPPKLVLGNATVDGLGFQGYMDEVKLWRRMLSLEEILTSQIAYSRELPGDASTGAVGYFRFNNVTEYIGSTKTLTNSVAGAKNANGEGTFSYEPMAVPWEPSSVTSVNGVSLLESPRRIASAPQTGMNATVTLTGFNFAESFATACAWGSELSAPLRVPALGLSPEVQPSQVGDCAPPEGTIPYLEKIDGEEGSIVSPMQQGTLGRPDGRPSLMAPYPTFTIGTPLVQSLPVAQTATSLTCEVPAVELPQFAVLTAGNVPTITPVPFEFAEVALECDGSNHLEANAVSELVVDTAYTMGYTMGAWVFPYAEEMSSDEGLDRRGRSLRSTDKNLRRKLAGHTGRVASTVLGFEAQAEAGGVVSNDGLIMYDGHRFFYYDDCILDVTQTGAPAAAGEWHFVMVSIASDGEGLLTVDGNSPDAFSTTCKPKPSGLFSLCQDYTRMDGLLSTGAHFRGLVDEVQVFRRSLSFELISQFMFKPYPLAAFPSTVGGVELVGQEERVAHFAFANPTAMLPLLAQVLPSDAAAPWAATAGGPWYPPTVIDVTPTHAAATGGTQLTVTGTNLARSQWLAVNLGGVNLTVPVDGYLPTGSAVTVTTTPAAAGEFPVRAQSHGGTNGTGQALFDTTITYAAAVPDLAVGLISRVSFTFVQGVTSVQDGMATAVDLAGGAGAHAYPEDNDYRAADKDMFENRAVLFDSTHPVVIPQPETASHTVCAWLRMGLGSSAPLPGAWKLVCVVSNVSATTAAVYFNGVVQQTCDMSATTVVPGVGCWYAAALADSELGSGDETGLISDLWVYDRALPAAALASLYYTQQFALHFDDSAPTEAAPATVVVPLAAELKFSVSMWVFPHSAAGLQTLVATDAADQMTDVFGHVEEGDEEGGERHHRLGLALGLHDSAATFAIYHGCACDREDVDGRACKNLMEYTSWKAKVLPMQWSYLTFVYPANYPAVEGERPNTLAILVNGMLRDLHTFESVVVPRVPPTLTLLLGQESTRAPSNGGVRPFDGLIYNLAWSTRSMMPWQVCVPHCLPLCRSLFLSLTVSRTVSPTASLLLCLPRRLFMMPWQVRLSIYPGLRTSKTPRTQPCPTPRSNAQGSWCHAPSSKIRHFSLLIVASVPVQVKRATQCPTLSASSGATVYDFNEGATAHAGNGGATGVGSKWTNSSYDDVTSPASTTLFGDLTGQLGGETGHIVVTSRTACSKKRVHGGDDYSVTLTAEDGPRPGETFPQTGKVVTLPAPRDTNDGNYHFEYNVVECAVYRASLTLGGEELESFDVDIRPGVADPAKTFIDGFTEGQAFVFPAPACFGVQTTFVIFARDQAGCLVSGHGDVFRVTLDGPHTIDAVVTPDAAIDGKYHVAFTPQAPGDYHLEVVLVQPDGSEAAIRTGQHYCVSVCGEGALSLTTNAGATVIEDGDPPDSAGETPLDLSYLGITMELWFQFPANFAPTETIYLLHKGGSDQLGTATKSWAVMLLDDRVSVEVYVGKGETRSASAAVAEELNASPAAWHHLATTYNGDTFAIYLDGAAKAVSGSYVNEGKMKPQSNGYDHPLLIGGNMPGGQIDEVKLWNVARTAAQIADSMFCAPYGEIDMVAAYFSFNEGAGTLFSGHGADCVPGSASEVAKQCLQGTLGLGATFTTDSTPVTFTPNQVKPSSLALPLPSILVCFSEGSTHGAAHMHRHSSRPYTRPPLLIFAGVRRTVRSLLRDSRRRDRVLRGLRGVALQHRRQGQVRLPLHGAGRARLLRGDAEVFHGLLGPAPSARRGVPGAGGHGAVHVHRRNTIIITPLPWRGSARHAAR